LNKLKGEYLNVLESRTNKNRISDMEIQFLLIANPEKLSTLDVR
jgi:hypothetical protein